MLTNTKIHILGIAGNSLSKNDVEIMGRCFTIVVSERLRLPVLNSLPDAPVARIIPVTPLKNAVSAIEEGLKIGDVAVLASGDPLFFGIGHLLVKYFGVDRLRITPVVSAMQLAFARLGVAWQDATFLSLHGREFAGMAHSILSSAKVCILTDNKNTPSAIAGNLLAELSPEKILNYTCFVGEYLGTDSEKLTLGSLQDIAKKQFGNLNVMIILRNTGVQGEDPLFGLQEHEFAHSRGLITKDEIRAAVIHALALPRKGVFWDVGAGSGSISVEVARLAMDLEVFAVEKNIEQINHITANRKKYSTYNLKPVSGEAPEVLVNLPLPDRVFIGGSGGNLEKILTFSAQKLKAGGEIVVTAVLETTTKEAPRFLYSQGLDVQIKRISVSRQTYPHTDCINLNPISIITGRKRS